MSSPPPERELSATTFDQQFSGSAGNVKAHEFPSNRTSPNATDSLPPIPASHHIHIAKYRKSARTQPTDDGYGERGNCLSLDTTASFFLFSFSFLFWSSPPQEGKENVRNFHSRRPSAFTQQRQRGSHNIAQCEEP